MRLWRYQIHKRDFASIGGKACLARIHATFSIVAAFLDDGIEIGGAVGFSINTRRTRKAARIPQSACVLSPSRLS